MNADATAQIRTERLLLTPLQVDDAVEMTNVLADVELYEFTGGQPPTASELTARYRAQVEGPPTQDEEWHNWIIRTADSGQAIGFVQATVVGETTDVAWLVAPGWQGNGIASEGAAAMCHWLAGHGVTQFSAHIHPNHVASERVAISVGFRRTSRVDEDGEVIWTGHLDAPPR